MPNYTFIDDCSNLMLQMHLRLFTNKTPLPQGEGEGWTSLTQDRPETDLLRKSLSLAASSCQLVGLKSDLNVQQKGTTINSIVTYNKTINEMQQCKTTLSFWTERYYAECGLCIVSWCPTKCSFATKCFFLLLSQTCQLKTKRPQ